MHIQVTPAGKLVGKVIHRFLTTMLFCIPIGLVIALLFYGVQCTRRVASEIFGGGGQAGYTVVVAQPQQQTNSVVAPNNPPASTAVNAFRPVVPPNEGRGTANIIVQPPVRDVRSENAVVQRVAEPPVNRPVMVQAEAKYQMYRYDESPPARSAAADDHREEGSPTMNRAASSEGWDRNDSSSPQVSANAPAAVAPQQEVRRFPILPSRVLTPAERQAMAPRERSGEAPAKTPRPPDTQASKDRIQKAPVTDRGSPINQTKANPNIRRQATPSQKGPQPPSSNKQKNSDGQRRGRSNDPDGKR